MLPRWPEGGFFFFLSTSVFDEGKVLRVQGSIMQGISDIRFGKEVSNGGTSKPGTFGLGIPRKH
jgi:hypothetical protein